VETEETILYEDITRNINTALTILFSVECLLKIFGFGLRVNLRFFNDIECWQRRSWEGTGGPSP